MANPSNLIRPPILNQDQIPQPINPQNQPQMNAALQQQITSIVVEQVRATIQALNILNDDLPNGSDIVIEERHRNNIGELDKIPDIVRCLREFSGNPAEFNSWRKSVERVLEIYDNFIGTAKYFGILSVIRNKIIGNADAVLESYNTPLNWKSIVKCLTLHYGDKRDLGTLEYQMTSLIQGKNSIQGFYQEVYTHLSLILNKIGCMEIGKESAMLLTQTYRDKALDTFIRGLNGELPKLLGIREPSDLPQALHLCLKLENQNFRAEYAYNHNNIKPQRQFQPPQPKRNINLNKAPFYPELTLQWPSNARQWDTFQYQNNQRSYQQPLFNPRFQLNNQPRQQFQPQAPYFQQNFIPSRPIVSKPQRPEPMDIDHSIQSKNINYQNRPRQTNQFHGKRPIPSSLNTPMPHNKMQRNFHIGVKEELPSNDMSYNQNDNSNSFENNYRQAIQDENLQDYIQDYYQQEIEQGNTHTEDLSDIHFLD